MVARAVAMKFWRYLLRELRRMGCRINPSADIVHARRLAEGATPSQCARVVKRWLKRRAKRG